ncbi:hypothetical protein [Gemmiger formicilis]|jgi:hypothetical protein|uniref:hypothetical protein n=1 Tax=Gemmiger formicilis TaxID=745368 RepID=UPI00351FE8C3
MITITGDAKEIATLIEELQGQRNVEFDAEKFVEELSQKVGKVFAGEFNKTQDTYHDGIFRANGTLNVSKDRITTSIPSNLKKEIAGL